MCDNHVTGIAIFPDQRKKTRLRAMSHPDTFPESPLFLKEVTRDVFVCQSMAVFLPGLGTLLPCES